MWGRAYIKTLLLELYVEGEVTTDAREVERAGRLAVGF